MPKSHDYHAPEFDAALPPAGEMRSQALATLEAQEPIMLTLPKGADVVDLAGHAALKFLGKLLVRPPVKIFAANYRLDVGLHVVKVHVNAKESFRLRFTVFPEGGDAGAALEAEARWQAQLDALARGGLPIESICSDAFLKNHVMDKKPTPAQDMLEGALRSVLRGKATTVIVLDQTGRGHLFAEMAARMKADGFSSATMYKSEKSFLTYNLDPARKVLQRLQARFNYSVYHDEKDGLWRISHYEGMVDEVVEQESPAGMLHTAADFTQDPIHREIEGQRREERKASQDRLDEIARLSKMSAHALDEVGRKLPGLRAKVEETQHRIAHWDEYARVFREEHPVLSEADILEKLKNLKLTNEGELAKRETKSNTKEVRQAAAEAVRETSKAIKAWEACTGTGRAKYLLENQPASLDALRALLTTQQERLQRAEEDQRKAQEDLDRATSDEDWDGDDLRRRVAWHDNLLVNHRQDRHRDWIERLKELMNETARKARRDAWDDIQAGSSELLPPDWADRVTRK